VSPEHIERRREHQLDSIYDEWRSGDPLLPVAADLTRDLER
jgi:hypothetical protein